MGAPKTALRQHLDNASERAAGLVRLGTHEITLGSITPRVSLEQKISKITRAAEELFAEARMQEWWVGGCISGRSRIPEFYEDKRWALLKKFAAILKSIPGLTVGDKEAYDSWIKSPAFVSRWWGWEHDPKGRLRVPGNKEMSTALQGAYRAVNQVNMYIALSAV